MERKIYTVYGAEAHTMTMALMEAANVADRIPGKNASILLKPNLVVAKSPESGATTHGGVLSGVIEYLQAHGFQNICIAEGSWVGDHTGRAFQTTGYDQVGRKYGVPLYDLKQDKTRTVKTAIGNMDVCCRALDAEYLIDLPVLKGHCQTVMTCALKNCKGCLPDKEKRRFHAMGLMKPIAALAAVLKPALTIVDSICGDLNFEEGGTPIQTDRMLLGFDPVQIDAYGCSLMGVDPNDVDYILLAEQMGAGSMAWEQKDLVFLNEPVGKIQQRQYGGMVLRLTRSVTQRSACSACDGALVHALYRMEREHHMTCQLPISIGQEFQGVPIEGVGIGRCCNGAAKQVKGCPPTSEEIMRVLMKNM